MKGKHRRLFVWAAAAGLVAVLAGLAVGANYIAQVAAERRIADTVACALNAAPDQTSAVIAGFPTITQIVAHELDRVTVVSRTGAETITLTLDDVDFGAGLHVTCARAEATESWARLHTQATSASNPSATAVTLVDDHGQVEALLPLNGRRLAVAFRLGHTRDTLTLSPQSIGLGDLHIPIARLTNLKGAAIDQLSARRTFTPNLPRGARITTAAATPAGIALTVAIDPRTLERHPVATGSSCRTTSGKDS